MQSINEYLNEQKSRISKRKYVTEKVHDQSDILDAIAEGFENLEKFFDNDNVVNAICDIICDFNTVDGRFNIAPNNNTTWDDIIGSNYGIKDIIFDTKNILKKVGVQNGNKNDYFVIYDSFGDLYTTSDIFDLPESGDMDALFTGCIDGLKPAIASIRNTSTKKILEKCFEKALKLL